MREDISAVNCCLCVLITEVKMIIITNLGLNVGVLNREWSSWPRCPQREVPLYILSKVYAFKEPVFSQFPSKTVKKSLASSLNRNSMEWMKNYEIIFLLAYLF
jgi:hypothetical protein